MKFRKLKNKNPFILVVLLIGFLTYVLFGSELKKLESNTSPFSDPVFKQVESFFESKIQPDNILINNQTYVWWVSSDEYNIINDKAYGLELQFDCLDYEASKFDLSLKKVASSFPAFIQEKGFTSNILNTSKSLTDETFYDYVQAFEKNDLKCVLTANPDCSGTGDGKMWQTISFSCTKDFDDNYKVQAPILKNLGIKDAVVSISKQVDNFAEIQVHYRRTGHYVIAVKNNGVWKELYSGQDIPSCSIMKRNNVPKELYGNCF